MAKLNSCYGRGQAEILTLPPPIAFENPPTSAQTNYAVGQEVYVPGPVATAFYKYMGAGVWVEFVSSTGEIISIVPTTPVTASTVAGVATIGLSGPPNVTTLTNHGVVLGQGTAAVTATTAGTTGQFLVSNGASADPTFQTATPQSVVTPVAGTTQATLSNHTYIANNATQTVFTLPTTSAVGDIINIVGSTLNTGGWEVTYTTGQSIRGPAGSSTTTTGNASTGAVAGQCMQIICTVANLTWVIQNNSGTITLT
jgi:hypothetical protein